MSFLNLFGLICIVSGIILAVAIHSFKAFPDKHRFKLSMMPLMPASIVLITLLVHSDVIDVPLYILLMCSAFVMIRDILKALKQDEKLHKRNQELDFLQKAFILLHFAYQGKITISDGDRSNIKRYLHRMDLISPTLYADGTESAKKIIGKMSDKDVDKLQKRYVRAQEMVLKKFKKCKKH